jgi:hypothetical protein
MTVRINTESLEARIAQAGMRLEHLQNTVRWKEEGLSELAKIDPANEVLFLYQLFIEVAKSVNEIQKELNRGSD